MEKRHPDWIEPAAQHLALAGLAFAMQRLGTGTEVNRDWALDALPAQVSCPTRIRCPRRRPAVLRLAHAATLLRVTPSTATSSAITCCRSISPAGELLRRCRPA